MKTIRKKALSLLLTLAMLVSMASLGGIAASAATGWNGTAASAYAGGTGTQQDPYRISTAGQLAYLAKEVNAGDNYKGKYFALTNDISLSGHAWAPIGISTPSGDYAPFDGVFNGLGHVVTGLVIGSVGAPDSTYMAGLFGYLEVDAVVENMGVDATIYSSSGGAVGGLVGYSSPGASIVNSYATGSVNVVGTIPHFIVTIGSLVGENDGSVVNSYATGSVSDSDNAFTGGLTGYNLGTITNCYAAGDVEGSDASKTGGLTGENDGTVTNGYWSTDASQTANGSPVGTKVGSGNGDDTTTGMTAVAMEASAFAATLTSNRDNSSAQAAWKQYADRNGGFPVLENVGAGRSGDSTLSGLALSSGSLNFASGTTSYSVTMDKSVSSITVTPTADESHAVITVNGASVTSGHASGAIALEAGSVTIITIAVTAQDGSQETYTVNVTRPDNSVQVTGAPVSSGSSSYTATVTAQNVGDGSDVTVKLGTVTINDSSSVLSSLLGSDPDASIKLTEIPASSATQAAAKSAAAKINTDNSIVSAFDIDLYKVLSDNSTTQLHQLGGNITVTLNLTDAQKAQITDPSTAKLYYYNLDTGALEDMHATFDMTAGTVTFTTNHFSTFVLAQVNTPNPKTGDNGLPIFPLMFLAGAMVMGCIFIGKHIKVRG